jgi:ABC-type multidrug transport system fused ATPase/permease subunit
VRRYLRLWRELLGLSWRRAPVLTVSLFVVEAAMLLPVVGWALALRLTVDETARGAVGAAVTAAVGAALVCTLTSVFAGLGGYLRYFAVDRVAEQDVRPSIALDIATLEGIDHLERSDFLDRVTVLRGAAWGLVAGAWTAVSSVFTAIRLVVSLLLLGSVSPWYLLLVLFTAAPLWCDQKARALVNKAETDTADDFRLQRQLFELATSADGGKELRVAGAADEVARRQCDAWDKSVSGRYRARLGAAWWQLAGWLCFTISFVVILAVVVQQATTGGASTGDAVLALTVAAALHQTMQAAVGQVTEALGAGRLIEPYLWLRDYIADERAERSAAIPPPGVLHRGITLDEVGYTYPGARRPALDSVSVFLPAGSVIAVVGEYGSGKTTLIKLLGKFYRPTTGAVRIDDVDLADLDTDKWRARISAAYQDFGRYEQTTVGESVGLGDLPRLHDDDRVAEAMRAADGDRLVSTLPQGLSTQLGRRFGGVELSEGQWQKLALARAAMRTHPLLFVLDEPTASLDAPSEHAIFRLYMARARELSQRTGAVTVVVSHRFSTVTGADLILVLDKGRLVEHGTHEQLLLDGGNYAGLYRIQADAYAIDPTRAAPPTSAFTEEDSERG